MSWRGCEKSFALVTQKWLGSGSCTKATFPGATSFAAELRQNAGSWTRCFPADRLNRPGWNKSWWNSELCALSARQTCCDTSRKSAAPCLLSRENGILPRCSASPSVPTKNSRVQWARLTRVMDRIDTEDQDRADMMRLARGHDASLNDLMNRHAGAVLNYLCRMLGNEDDANDLAQETFVRVFRHRERYDGSKFTTWLSTIPGD